VTADDDRRRAFEELWAALEEERRIVGEELTTVCPEHLRFVPCRRCEPGEEKHSTDPHDVERTIRFQHGAEAAAQYRWDNPDHFG
jgi:hypothetical protein